MGRVLNHVTDNTETPGSVKRAPDAWINQGAVLTVFYDKRSETPDTALYVNTAPNLNTDIKLKLEETAQETDGRNVYVMGSEGAMYITDDGL